MILIFPLDLFAILQGPRRIKICYCWQTFFPDYFQKLSVLAKLSWWHFWYYACFALEKVRHMPMPSGVVSFLYDFCIWKAHHKIVWIFAMQKTRSAFARNKWGNFYINGLWKHSCLLPCFLSKDKVKYHDDFNSQKSHLENKIFLLNAKICLWVTQP